MKNSLNFYVNSYNKNSHNYDETYFFLNDYKGEAEFIKKLLDSRNINLSKSKLLDLGCGTGNLFSFLPALQKVGIDISNNMIKIAKEKNIPKSKFIVRDILDFETKEKFDIIYISTFLVQTFKTFNELENFLFKIKNNLSENGVILFSWIDEKRYSEKYREETFEFKLKNGWNCHGKSFLENKRRYVEFEFIKSRKTKIKSHARYLILSEKNLQKINKRLKMNLKLYEGKNNGLKEDYHKWAVLYKT